MWALQDKGDRLTWFIVGDGTQSDRCGSPVPLAIRTEQREQEGKEPGVIIWGDHACSSSQCPKCCDKGYVSEIVKREIKEIMAQISAIARKGKFREIIEGQWRRIKAYHAIVSLKAYDKIGTKQELEEKRHEAIKIAKEHGFIWGLIVGHPYRGDRAGSGEERRASLDRGAQSLHFHVVGLGYWISSAKEGQEYLFKVPNKKDSEGGHSGILGTVKKTIASLAGLRARLSGTLRYELDHAGRWNHGQYVVRFGSRNETTSKDLRPDPQVFYEVKDCEQGFFTGMIRGMDVDVYQQKWIYETLGYYHKRGKPPPDHALFLQHKIFRYPSLICSMILDDEYGIEWDKELVTWCNLGMVPA